MLDGIHTRRCGIQFRRDCIPFDVSGTYQEQQISRGLISALVGSNSSVIDDGRNVDYSAWNQGTREEFSEGTRTIRDITKRHLVVTSR